MAKTNLNKIQKDLNAQEIDIRLKQGASFIGSSNDPFTTPTRDNAQTYPYDYFAGTDCKIFFGDIWVDDIVTIQYNVTQSKTPIYGYASQNFDAVARGQVLVEGTLAVSFKETGYLNIIQAQLEAQKRRTETGIQSKIQKLSEDKIQKYIPGINSINEEGEKIDFTYSATGTPEIIKQEQTIEQILSNKKGKPNSSSSAMDKTFKLNEKGDRDFEDFAEVLEDSIWGDSNGHFLELEDKLKRVDEFDYNDVGGINTAKNTSYADVLNIMLTFGDINDYRAEHTLVVLNDVHFLSTSMIVSPDGNPIAEVYNFIARDINKSITSKTKNISLQPVKLTVGNTETKLSKLADVDEVQKFIEKRDVPKSIILKFESGFEEGPNQNLWKVLGFQKLAEEYFAPNKITPFIDQLSSFVEREVNSFNNGTKVRQETLTKYDQLIVTVDLGTDISKKITMILKQGIPGTYTFKVISPTRSGFKSVLNITRDDLFLDSYKPPIQEEYTKEEQSKNTQQISKENANILDASTTLGITLPEFTPNINLDSKFGPGRDFGIEQTLREAATTQTTQNTQPSDVTSTSSRPVATETPGFITSELMQGVEASKTPIQQSTEAWERAKAAESRRNGTLQTSTPSTSTIDNSKPENPFFPILNTIIAPLNKAIDDAATSAIRGTLTNIQSNSEKQAEKTAVEMRSNIEKQSQETFSQIKYNIQKDLNASREILPSMNIGPFKTSPVMMNQPTRTPTLAEINNNPGNLRYYENLHKPGYLLDEATGSDKYGFAVFPDKETGVRALTRQVKINQNKDLTVREFISSYAPPNQK